ncbi:MAG: hypothetical protein AAB461_00260 [Patescibacteria group bacterium]
MSKKFGALPPPGIEWQIGKTAASISFVGNAEAFLKTCRDEQKSRLLSEVIKKVKGGSVVLQEWLAVEEYLDKQPF